MIYKAGDAVPTDWFSKLENVVSATFHSDCEETVISGQRVVRQIGDGPHMVYFEGNGEHMTVEAVIPTSWQTRISASSAE
jgi:hypothetical protein